MMAGRDAELSHEASGDLAEGVIAALPSEAQPTVVTGPGALGDTTKRTSATAELGLRVKHDPDPRVAVQRLDASEQDEPVLVRGQRERLSALDH
jgi:hypothetical protein